MLKLLFDKSPNWTHFDFIILTLIVLAFLFPLQMKNAPTQRNFRDLKKQFASIHLLALFLFFGLIIAFSFACYQLLSFMAGYIQINEGVFQLRANGFLILVSIALAISLAIAAIFSILKFYLKSAYSDYLHFYNLMYHMNATRFIAYITPFIFLLSWIGFYLYLPASFIVDEKGIRYRALFSQIERNYSFSDISLLEKRMTILNGDG